MKTILSLILSLVLFNPVFAGGHGGRGGFGGHGGRGGFGNLGLPGHPGAGDRAHGVPYSPGKGERHEGWRGNHGRFNGFGGLFYGQIIILDDGCYFWDGLAWEITGCED